MSPEHKNQTYLQVIERCKSLIANEQDLISVMATVVAELHHSFSYFHWTGFYRVTEPLMLKIGPYQGGHGCLRIPFDRGVCGHAATTRQSVRVDDVNLFDGHIACSHTTQSEIVVPVLLGKHQLIAVLDIDSDKKAAFCQIDEHYLELICEMVAQTQKA